MRAVKCGVRNPSWKQTCVAGRDSMGRKKVSRDQEWMGEVVLVLDVFERRKVDASRMAVAKYETRKQEGAL